MEGTAIPTGDLELLTRLFRAKAREQWRWASGLAISITWLGFLLILVAPAYRIDPATGTALPALAQARVWFLGVLTSMLPLSLASLSHLLINRSGFLRVQPEVPPKFRSSIVAVADASWTYEIAKAHCSLNRAEAFAAAWGTTASMAIVGAMVAILRPDGLVRPSGKVALAVLGTTLVSFSLELARLAIRTSHDDATKRMFAEALRTLIVSIVSTLVLCLMVSVVGPDQIQAFLLESTSPLGPLGIGASVGIIGPPAFDWARTRLGALFGIEQKKAGGGTPLDALGDMGPTDIARLAEEGIETIEALVNTPIPRLFLNTRYSLERIVTWNDFGLLITCVGAGPATDLRTRWGLRGSLDVRRAALDPNESQRKKVLIGIFKKTLRVDGDTEAELVIHQIAHDHRVATVELLRGTVLRPKAPEADKEGS